MNSGSDRQGTRIARPALVDLPRVGFWAWITASKGARYANGVYSGPPWIYDWQEVSLQAPSGDVPITPYQRNKGRFGTAAGNSAGGDLGPAINWVEHYFPGGVQNYAGVAPVGLGTLVRMELSYDSKQNKVWSFTLPQADDALFSFALFGYGSGAIPILGDGMYWGCEIVGLSTQAADDSFGGNTTGLMMAGLNYKNGNPAIPNVLACHLDELNLRGHRLPYIFDADGGGSTDDDWSNVYVGKRMGYTEDGLAIVFFRGGLGAGGAGEFGYAGGPDAPTNSEVSLTHGDGNSWDIANGDSSGTHPGSAVNIAVPTVGGGTRLWSISSMGKVLSISAE